MRSKIGTALLLGALAFSPGIALAAGDSLEQIVVESATTPAQHAALAKFYRSKAEAARAEAKEHTAMAGTYVPTSAQQKTTWGTTQERQKMAEHCKSLAQQSEAAAKDYDALAKMHDEMAKK